MLDLELLRLIATPEEYIPQILDYDARYAAAIEPLAAEYMLCSNVPAGMYYPNDTVASDAYYRTKDFVAKVSALSPLEEEQHMLCYLFWLHCVPYLRRFYSLAGIDESVFRNSMADLAYKAQECIKVKGHLGVFTDWFLSFFDMKLFGLGRMEYVMAHFPYDSFTATGYTLRRGDPVCHCHIPSSGPLTIDLIQDSLRKAYAFFKPYLQDNILPVVTRTWLLYPPYRGPVFPIGSNTEQFANLFATVESMETETFDDCWRVFSIPYPEDIAALPTETSMQRRFVDYIRAGGKFGKAYGVLLYDGERDVLLTG